MVSPILPIICLPLEQFFALYWPYLKSKFANTDKNQSNNREKNNTYLFSNQAYLHKLKVIYENTMLGIMIGLTFFHLIPITNTQLAQQLKWFQFAVKTKNFPFGNLIVIIVFVVVLVLTNYFYNCNTSNVKINKFHYRSRSQYQYELLTNQKLKIKRRIGAQSITTQILISLPSILATSCLVVQNKFSITFASLMFIAFQKYVNCTNFGRTYQASGLQQKIVIKNCIIHCSVSIIYMTFIYLLCQKYNLLKGIANGITAGAFLYEVMIQKMTKNFQEKKQLTQKVIFLFSGIFISCII